MAIVFLAAMAGVTGAPELVVRSTAEPAAAADLPAARGLTVLAGKAREDVRTDGSASTARFRKMLDMAATDDGKFLFVLEAYASAGSPAAVRRVSTSTGEVTTYSTDPLLGQEPSHIEVDASGNPWVAIRNTSTDRYEILKVGLSGDATVMVSDMCCSKAGRAFHIDDANGFVYYAMKVGDTPDAARALHLRRLQLDSLPAAGSSGEVLGTVPRDTSADLNHGPVSDMVPGPDGVLYMAWAAKGLVAYTSGNPLLEVVNADDSPNWEHGWQAGVMDRLAFRTGSSSIYNLCAGTSCHFLERHADFGRSPVEERSVLAGGITDGIDLGDPGEFAGPSGLEISPDGATAWIADAGNFEIRKLALPPDPNVLSPEELCAECNPGERRLSAPKVLDPVDLPSGSLTESFTDLAVPSRGRPLTVSRTYNSLLAQRPGRFGLGWSSPLDLKLEEWSGYAQVRQENGSILPFSRLLDGTYLAPPRVTSTLVKDGTGWVLTRNLTDVVRFDAEGRVTSFEERQRAASHPARVTTLSYPTGQIVMTSPGGRTLTFTLDGNRVASVTDDSTPARSVSYSYNTAGQLTGVQSFKVNDDDPAAVTWGYEYNAEGLLNHVTNPRGFRNETHYDARGRVDWQKDYAGAQSDVVYGPDGPETWREVITPAFNAAGDRSRTRYELTNLLVTSVTTGYGTAQARTVRYEYDEALMAVDRVIGPGEIQLAAYDYDEHGNIELAVDAARGETEFTYEDGDFNQPKTITDPLETVTTNTYVDGYLRSTSTPIKSPTGVVEATAVTTFERTDAAHPEDVTAVIGPDEFGKPSPKKWRMQYRAADGLVDWQEDPEGNRTTFHYDSRGFVDWTVSPRGNVTGANPEQFRTHFEVNDFGMVQQVTDPLDKLSSQRFDPNGNVVSVTDANTRVASTTYDAMDRPRVVTRADSTPALPMEIETTYFPNGTVDAQIDAADNVTSYTYSVHGELLTSEDPRERVTSYLYDPRGRLSGRLDPGLGCPATGCVTYGYDDANRPTSITYVDPATPDVTSITYDALGRRKSMTQSGRSPSTWTWDSASRLRSSTEINGMTTGYGWDVAGNLKTITYPGLATPVTYTYDAAGQMTSVKDWSNQTTSFTYDPDGNWKNTSFPASTGNLDVRTYDAAGRLETITWNRSGTVLGSLTLGRDDKGLVETETPTGATGTSTRTWGYDKIDQLTDVDAASLDYDPTGNLTTTEDGHLQVFDPASQLCWSSPTATGGSCDTPPSDATTFTYDSRGNRTRETPPSGTARQYSYDADNRLTGAKVPADATSGGGFVSLSPSRVADSRVPKGVCNSGTCSRLNAQQTVTIQVTGRDTVPASGIAAVTGTVTIASPAADGYARVNPGGSSAAATLNYASGANQGAYVIAPVDSQGRITIYTSAAADVVVDITGYYTTPGTSGAGFEALPPDRLVDTRTPNNVGLCPTTACTTPAAGTTTQVQASGRVGLPSTGINAVVLSLSIVGPSTSGYARINPSSGSGTATINYEAGKTINEVVVAPLNAQGRLSVFVSTSVNFVIDITGYLAAGDNGAVLRTITPHNSVDTRSNKGTCNPGPCNRFTAGERLTVTATGIPTGAEAALAWITVTGPAANGYLRVAPVGPGTGTAGAATIDYQTGSAADSLVIIPLTPTGTFDLASFAATDVVIDITGYITGTEDWTYTYDATGLRTSKAETVIPATTFAWNRAGGLPTLLTQRSSTGDTHIIYGPGGTPLEQRNPDGTILWYHQDHLGSTRMLTGASGTALGVYSYDAYGHRTTHTGTVTPLLDYTGQYTDLETGLQYLRARYHDPSTGSFLSRDPLVFSTGEPYAYGASNPANFYDPSGLWPWDDACINNPWGEDDCDSIAEQHPGATREVVDAAGGVVDGVTLGHGRESIDAVSRHMGVGRASRYVDWDSDTTGWGRRVGHAGLLPIAVAAPSYYGLYATGIVAADCSLGGLDEDCVANLIATAFVGLVGLPGKLFVNTGVISPCIVEGARGLISWLADGGY